MGLIADLTLSEIQSEIGKYHLGPGEVIHGTGIPADKNGRVADKVNNKKSTYRNGDNAKDRGKRPRLWEEAQALFPVPTHVKPRMKGYLLWSERDSQGLAVDLFSNTWRNPANAQFKRQKLYFNILPRINGPEVYQLKVPIDDWDNKVHRRISRAIQRAVTENRGWMWFDNALHRGYILYLTSVPGLAGFEPVGDIRTLLIDSLKAIRPPGRGEVEGRFRPYGGSQNWVGNVGDSGEEDADRWEVVAVAEGPTDFVGIEAECVVSGVATQYQGPYWRGQPYQGLAMRHPSKEAFVAFVQDFPEQYTLTKAAMIDERLVVK